MGSVSVRDARLPTLSSPNLRKLDSSKLDKNRFLRSYIRSQEAHLSSYVAEGKSLTASWKVAEIDAPPKKPGIARDVDLESGFGTPILKPRAATTPKSGARAQDAKRDRGRPQTEAVKEHEGRGSSASGKVVVHENVAVRGERDDDRGVGDSSRAKRGRPKKVRSSSMPKEKVPIESKSKEKVSRKPPAQGGGRGHESEEEYCNRLAERRERRRAKKAIVDPKPSPPASEATSQDSGNKKKSSGKKGKGLSMPAGLALMHGFSATNIGKNRLTLEPAVGVFNKGKASAKTKVKKAKEKRPTSKTKMFSENVFLRKTKADCRKAMSTSSESGGSNHHVERESESASTEPDRPKGKTNSSERNAQKRKRPRSPSTADPSVDECKEATPPDHVRLQRRRKTERPKSPVWDIELEDGQLPSESHSDKPVDSDTGTKVAGTLLLDTHAFSSKWAIAKDKKDSLRMEHTNKTTERVEKLQDDHRSDGASTIDPSHSASQVAYSGTTFSRFFTRPSRTQGAGAREDSVCHNDATPPVALPASHRRDVPDDPHDTVQSRMAHPAWDIPVNTLDAMDEDFAEPLLSSPRLPSESRLVRDKSPLPAMARSSSSASSSRSLREAVLEYAPCGGASDGTHPEYALSTSFNLPSTPPPIWTGAIEPVDFEDEPVASGRDWTTEFLGLLGEEVPADLFLSNAAGYANSIEQPIGEDDDFEVHVEPTEDELLAARDIDTWGLEGEGDPGQLCDPYLALVEEDPGGVDYPQGDALAMELEESGSVVSWRGPPEEVDDMSHRRKRVKFSEDVRCYEDGRDMADIDSGEVWKWQPEPDIIDTDSDGLDEGGLTEFGAPDGRSAETAYPDTALSEASCPFDLDVAVEDESSQAEEDVTLGGAPSEMEEERSVLGSLQRFSQGRALLMGVGSEIGVDSFGTRLGVSAVEEDVARNLRGHWRPQRF